MSSAINLQSLNVGTAFPPGMQDGSGGLQTYVDQSNTLSAVNGNPGAGQFRSSVVNRASIPNITTDLKASMGIDRIMVQQIYEIQGETGQSGERVFGALNDDKGLIRFVGNWSSVNNTYGARAQSGSNITDYVEITFYGTGLNLLISTPGGTAKNIVASVDGGAEGSNLVPAGSDVLGARNYSPNIVIAVASGLSLGLHTVKLRNNTASVGMDVCGFEVLNASASINVNPGSAYSQFKKNTLSSAISASYNATFDQILKDGVVSGSLGTRGARALVYLDTDGAVKKRAVAVNSAQANLTLADHTNEEIIRTYHWREFGAGRSDDFSMLTSPISSSNLAFTLDDGTTSLVGALVSSNTISGEQTFRASGGVNNYAIFTFVGTGLDIVWTSSATGTNTSGSNNISIDGGSPQTLTATATSGVFLTQKIVSGLPYGTHTVKFYSPADTNVWNLQIKQFIVYQPKKPSLPSGAIELADYNVMADYVANNTAGASTLATGILRKTNVKEQVYVGSWTASFDTLTSTGFSTFTTTNNDYDEYVFFGTGVELRISSNTVNSHTGQISIDGSTNLSSFTTGFYGNISSFTASTGTYVTNAIAGQQYGMGLKISNLILGIHKIRITKTAGSGSFNIECFDIITPIHSPKSNTYADLQNTLPIGSQSIGDSRKFNLVKDVSSAKAWAQATGLSGITNTTTSTSDVPLPAMSVCLKTSGGRVRVFFSGVMYNSSAPAVMYTTIYINGSPVGVTPNGQPANGTYNMQQSNMWVGFLPAGVHKIDVYWRVNIGTGSFQQGTSILIAEEI